jgi:hypothetical protein
LSPYVRRACAEQGLEYCEVSFLRTNKTLLGHLHGVSRSTRRREDSLLGGHLSP